MKAYYREMVEEDFGKILEMKLRQSDEDELRASTGIEPVEALALSLAYSKITWVIIYNNQIAGVFGLGHLRIKNTGQIYGVPWLLASDDFNKFSFTFVKQCREVINLMLDEHPHLINFVDVRHETAIRWLKWLGFKVDKTPCDNPITEQPFYKFTMDKTD